ncbi:AarF/ABC1/UbiB kinase family protein [Geitlerinema sp. PCC 9228]|uniref:ABC1 kinase family protein n=1 Tax=Geitlerinema sp. PCC 9228 TaxID=111611 RepID=UPI0008F990A2|nr:AarF/ABC1/UbiB kinase family protein [Geitlerinema sp. PCC 9228]
MVKPLHWQKTKYAPLARQAEIFSAAAKFLFFLWSDSKLGRNSVARKKQRSQWLVQKLLDLGPTFIKIGQALSTRADLLPREYVEALGGLQDKVPPFPAEEAIALVETELGSSIYSLYREFDHFPIAAASLGQVHKAKLHTGEDVVVKVQRPGLERLFQLDFQALGKLVRFCHRYLRWTRQYNLEGIYNEFFNILYQEIDYIQEGRNEERFAENFRDYEGVIVPRVYWRYTTTKVLTVEYIPGIKVDDRKTIEDCGLDPAKINQIGISCYLKQLLVDGFFQADPHPGNLAIHPETGSIIFYDFGMLIEVNPLNKQEMLRTLFAVLRKDTNEVVDTLVAMGLLEPMGDMKPVRRLVAFLLDKFTEKPVDFQAFGEIKQELYVMFEKQPFRLPPEMTYILKALTTLDGIARSLDPKYNLVAAAKPFIKSLTGIPNTGKTGSNLVREVAIQTRDFVRSRFNQPSKAEIIFQHLDQRIQQGEWELQVRSIESDRALKRLNLAIKSLIYTGIAGFTFLVGAFLTMQSLPSWAIFAFVIAGVFTVILIRNLSTLAMRERMDKMVEK